jgi:hypothetical protein
LVELAHRQRSMNDPGYAHGRGGSGDQRVFSGSSFPGGRASGGSQREPFSKSGFTESLRS